jgi:hypothetical protein
LTHLPDDLIERLGATDPAADSERLSPDEQREADELLARLLATPPAATEQRKLERGRVRRWALAAAVAVGVAAVGWAGIDVLDSDAPGPDVVARAVAAVNRDDVIYHFVERRQQRAS